MVAPQSPPNTGNLLLRVLSIVGAIVDGRYKAQGGKRPGELFCRICYRPLRQRFANSSTHSCPVIPSEVRNLFAECREDRLIVRQSKEQRNNGRAPRTRWTRTPSGRSRPR